MLAESNAPHKPPTPALGSVESVVSDHRSAHKRAANDNNNTATVVCGAAAIGPSYFNPSWTFLVAKRKRVLWCMSDKRLVWTGRAALDTNLNQPHPPHDASIRAAHHAPPLFMAPSKSAVRPQRTHQCPNRWCTDFDTFNHKHRGCCEPWRRRESSSSSGGPSQQRQERRLPALQLLLLMAQPPTFRPSH